MGGTLDGCGDPMAGCPCIGGAFDGGTFGVDWYCDIDGGGTPGVTEGDWEGADVATGGGGGTDKGAGVYVVGGRDKGACEGACAGAVVGTIWGAGTGADAGAGACENVCTGVFAATAGAAENVCAGAVAAVGVEADVGIDVGTGAETAGDALTAVNEVVGTSELAVFSDGTGALGAVLVKSVVLSKSSVDICGRGGNKAGEAVTDGTGAGGAGGAAGAVRGSGGDAIAGAGAAAGVEVGGFGVDAESR